jgi:hypothetical protein
MQCLTPSVLQQGSELAVANGGTAAWLNDGHLRPRDGTGSGARAPGNRDKRDACKEERKGGEERGSPQSGAPR